jgi:hypothetical protein
MFLYEKLSEIILLLINENVLNKLFQMTSVLDLIDL